jgi:hypothetical protein
MVASLSCEKVTLATQPAKKATRARTGGGERPAEAAEEKMVVDARQETFALGEAEKLQDADAARDGLQAGALIET